MKLMWESITMTRRVGRTPHPSQQQFLLPYMQSALMKVSDLLPGSETYAVSPILSQTIAQCCKWGQLTIGSACATPGHPPGCQLEEQEMVIPETDVDPDPGTEGEGTNIKVRRVRNILIIISIQNHNNRSKILHDKQSAFKTTHLDHEISLHKSLEKFTGKTSPKTKTEAEGIYRHQ